MGRLAGKTALVTGAAKGIGRATAIALAKDGANVVVNYLSSAGPAEEVVKQIGPDRAIAIQGDVSTLAGGKSVVAKAVERFGKIDILVLNAGILLQEGGLDSATEEAFDKLYAANVKGPMFMVQAAVPHMPTDGSGRIMLFSTSLTNASGITPNYLLYASSKGAVEQMTRVLAKDLGKRKQITVNTISPGPTGTAAFFVGKSEDMVKTISSWNPFGRLGTPEEIANAVCLIAGPESSWINGQNLRINGGMTVG